MAELGREIDGRDKAFLARGARPPAWPHPERHLGPGRQAAKGRGLARDLGCARSTVQRAMQDLSDAGLVDRRRRGGTTVHKAPVTRATLDIPVARDEVEARGATYGYQLLDRRVETRHPVTAGFELRAPQPMLHVKALHLADNRPFLYEDRWISLATVPEIAEVDLSRDNANEWLLQNRPYSRCDLRFYAENADAETARVMDIPPGQALFVIDRTTWIEGAPITTVRAIAAPGYRLSTRI
ncbi:MAG: GntR family transcriptional regulator [Paracoccaceae bacterium]